MSIITKKGDQGYTRLFDGTKVLKSSIRPETYGTIDELFSFLGIIRFKIKNNLIDNEKVYIKSDFNNLLKDYPEYISIVSEKEIIYFDSLIYLIQKKLITLMSELAVRKENLNKFCKNRISNDDIFAIEIICYEIEKEIGKLNSFIIPGENEIEAYLNYARSLTRKVERLVVRMKKYLSKDSKIVQFLNRLSDLLFLMGIYILKK